MKHNILVYISILALVFSFACNKRPDINPSNLDSHSFIDSSITHPENYLVTSSFDSIDTARPVLIAAHGYTATPFEWMEFQQFINHHNQEFYLSRVLLGGHGRDYDTFNSSTWQEWQRPIINEYNRLYNMGFRNISLAGSSTGCPLILNLISTNAFDQTIAPQHIFFIDPIVEPSNKLLKFVNIAGFFMPFIKVDMTPEEMPYWYQFRGKESLSQLNHLLRRTQHDLKKGITLPVATRSFQVFKVKKDDSADPISAKWLYHGVKMNTGEPIDTFMIPSSLHVFTRLKGRASITNKDKERQEWAFEKIAKKMMQ